MRRSMLLVLIAPLLLGACATETSRTVVSSACPSTTDYSKDTQSRAADELDALPPGSALGQMIVDYGQLRKKLRKCNG